MNSPRGRSLRSLLLVAGAVLALASLFGLTRTGPAAVAIDDSVVQVTGPYAHENLSVFLIHSNKQDERQFITLNQGLENKGVTVTEKGDGQVNELVIENQSDLYLFLQEGDRVTGGKQDRIVHATEVISPHSGKKALQAFCVEHGRWTAGASGSQFGNPSNLALAPKEVREAAKYVNSQSGVWEAVQGKKGEANQALAAPNTNSSLTETLDAPQIKKLSDEFAQALADVIKDRNDVVGVAIVINGKIEEVNLYPNHQLLTVQYPRLLQSYALEAALRKDKANNEAVVSAAEVAHWMRKAGELGSGPESVNARLGEVNMNTVWLELDFAARSTNPYGGYLQGTAEVINAQGSQVYHSLGRIHSGNEDVRAAFRARLPSDLTQEQNATQINLQNSMEVHNQPGRTYCKTEFEGKPVHYQFMSRTAPSARPTLQPSQAANPAPTVTVPQPQPPNQPGRN